MATKGIPREEGWLIGDLDDAMPQYASKRIPRKLFKVNILDHGHLQPIFDRDLSTLNGSIPDDMAILNMQRAHMSWRQLNPAYDIRYFDLNACRLYLKLHFHPIFLRAFDCLEAYAAKTDLFRYLLVYREGGWYSDWKEVCLKENLLDFLSEGNTTWFSTKDPYSKDLKMLCHQNAFFGATPRHVVLRNVIRRVLNNI